MVSSRVRVPGPPRGGAQGLLLLARERLDPVLAHDRRLEGRHRRARERALLNREVEERLEVVVVEPCGGRAGRPLAPRVAPPPVRGLVAVVEVGEVGAEFEGAALEFACPYAPFAPLPEP